MPLFKFLAVYMERLKRKEPTWEKEINAGIYQLLALPGPLTEDDNSQPVLGMEKNPYILTLP